MGKAPGLYGLRWFTPGGEIDLCGHATLASAYAVFHFLEPEARQIDFDTRSGRLTVTRQGALMEMDLPAYDLNPTPVTEAMEQALGVRPREAWMGRDLPGLLLQVTAPGEDGFDCVSRTFAPKLAIAEDPVCGSGHCHIAPYWLDRLGRTHITAFQASPRTGVLHCRREGKRVFLAGSAALYAVSELMV